ncbi:(2Fe-2S)-binding protein [Tropicimonas sp. IMCC34011]|uniref:(2Fe-2S)-binding protein n=1 Tax=Tropicimonas sp. IMCC34011 TaxID=2248759 RepID=UPI001E3988CD|nr:(2Fe-2S)-binding protein [Tropicimonas sp. IMCC34011]
MKPAFELLPRNASDPEVTVTVDGTGYDMREGENLAAELLRLGMSVTRRTPVSGAPRGPFCMMGACYDCLVEIEGARLQACRIKVTADLRISSIGGETEGALP